MIGLRLRMMLVECPASGESSLLHPSGEQQQRTASRCCCVDLQVFWVAKWGSKYSYYAHDMIWGLVLLVITSRDGWEAKPSTLGATRRS